MTDIVVVGAGSAGSFTSYLLARSGFEVALLDKGSGRKERIVCTGVIGREAFQRFSLPQEAMLREIHSFKIYSSSGDSFPYKHCAPFASVVDREYLHRWFFTKALREGVMFFPGSHVEDFVPGTDGMKILFRSDRTLQSITGKVVVLAMGANLCLLEKAGMKGPPAFLQGIQIEAEVENLNEVEVYLGQEVAPKSFAWSVPLQEGRAKIGLSTERDGAGYLHRLLQNPLLKARLKKQLSKPGFRFIPLGMSEKSAGERVLAVGDAAGQVKTTTGGGVYYGLIGAELGAETIRDAFLRNDFSERTFKKYEERWQGFLKGEIQTGLLMRRIFASFDDRRINLAISLANRDGIRPLIMKKAKFDWQKDFLFSLFKRPIIQKLFL